VWVPSVLRLIPVINARPDAVDPGRFDLTTANFIDGQRNKKPPALPGISGRMRRRRKG
jgi:hypothetical protein